MVDLAAIQESRESILAKGCLIIQHRLSIIASYTTQIDTLRKDVLIEAHILMLNKTSFVHLYHGELN